MRIQAQVNYCISFQCISLLLKKKTSWTIVSICRRLLEQFTLSIGIIFAGIHQPISTFLAFSIHILAFFTFFTFSVEFESLRNGDADDVSFYLLLYMCVSYTAVYWSVSTTRQRVLPDVGLNTRDWWTTLARFSTFSLATYSALLPGAEE